MLFLRFLGAERRGGGCILYFFPEPLPFFFHFSCRDIFFPEFMEIADRLIRHFFCLSEDGVRLLVCLPDDAVSLFIELFLSLGCLLFQAFSFPAVRRDLFPFFFDRAPARLEIAQQVLKGDVLLAQPLLRVLDDIVRQPQLAGDGKCITLPGNPDEQPIGRTQAFDVELTACIFHAGRGERVYFQFAVMRGCHSADIAAVQMGQDGNGKRRPLGRVCPGAQLIEEDEGALIYLFQERNNICHMRGKCTQALLNALLVTDIRIDLMEHCQLRTVACRDVEPCLSHQSEEPDGLKRHSLSSGIRAGDDQESKIFPQGDCDRDNGLLIQQRMPSFADPDASLFVKDRTASPHGEGQSAPCKDKIQIRKRPVVRADLFDILRCLLTEAGKDRLDLLLLFGVEFF